MCAVEKLVVEEGNCSVRALMVSDYMVFSAGLEAYLWWTLSNCDWCEVTSLAREDNKPRRLHFSPTLEVANLGKALDSP